METVSGYSWVLAASENEQKGNRVLEEFCKSFLFSPVVAALVIGAFSIFTVGLPLRRFRNQKWWERRADADASILDAMHKMLEENDKVWDAHERGSELSEETRRSLRSTAKSGEEEIARRARIGSFIISEKAEDVLAILKGKSDKAWNEAKLTGDYYSAVDSEALHCKRLYAPSRRSKAASRNLSSMFILLSLPIAHSRKSKLDCSLIAAATGGFGFSLIDFGTSVRIAGMPC